MGGTVNIVSASCPGFECINCINMEMNRMGMDLRVGLDLEQSLTIPMNYESSMSYHFVNKNNLLLPSALFNWSLCDCVKLFSLTLISNFFVDFGFAGQPCVGFGVEREREGGDGKGGGVEYEEEGVGEGGGVG